MSLSDNARVSAIVDNTLAFYEGNAVSYAANTFALDLGREQLQFLACLPPASPGANHRILDAGCGSGRDALAFARLGLDVVAFDGSEQLAAQARILTGLDVRRLRFDEMAFLNEFDGVWACASLLHLPPGELDDVVSRIRRALVVNGAFYACFKAGEGGRFDARGRYFHDFTPARLATYLAEQGFVVEAVTVRENALEPGSQWVNAFTRKRA